MIQRKKRIELSQFDSDWAKINNNQEDCYILITTPGIDEIVSFQSAMEKLADSEDSTTQQIYEKFKKWLFKAL